MNDIQGWFCTGTLREDCKLKFTPNNFPICEFELFSHRTYTIKDVQREENLTAACTILGDLGKQLAPSLKAGVRVMVRGRWRLNEWTDQKTGQPRKRHVVTVDDAEVLLQYGAPVREAPQGPPAEDNLPF